MPESENALWAKTRRNMAAPRRRTERSESAAERARKAPRPTDSRRTFTTRRRNCAQSKYVRIVGTKKEQQKRCPTAHIAFRARRTPCRAVFCSPLLRPAGAFFLKGRHKFALWNDTIALRLKKTGRAAFRRRRAQIGWRSKKRLCYALFCPSAFFVKHSANFLKNAKGHHKFICANDNITLPGRKSRPCTAYSF